MFFSLALPGETRFGCNRLQELPEILAHAGGRVALAHGGESYTATGLRERMLALCAEAGVGVIELPPQTREPEPEDVDAGAAQARAEGARLVVAIGGGSVLDLGKAVAALATQDPAYAVRAYLEGVGDGRALGPAPLPFIAIPTTAGTGSEATKNAVISSSREGFKKSLRDPRMMADVAIIDPELTLGLPPHLTAHTGLDALTQLIEAYTSLRAQPVTNALALRGIEAARALPRAFYDGNDRDAREAVSLASYLSGVCLANAGLGAAHGIAAALGSVAPIGHGLACALALPWVMAINLPVVTERYAEIAAVVTGEPCSNAHDGAVAAVRYVWQLLQELDIPRAIHVPGLAAALQEDQLPRLARLCQGNSLRGNPRALTESDLLTVLRAMRDASDPCALLG
ncbi:MAG TPA: iron-containing alcohol dehydrogenase [Armatimonadota bacterium]|jgi:alcohol dehydrogenase class IV